MSSEAPTTPIPPAQEASSGAWSRLLRVFTQPAAVFGELSATPTWLPPLIVIMLLSIGAQLVVAPRLDMEGTIRQSMAERTTGPKMSDAEMDRAVEMGSKVGSITQWLAPVFALVGLFALGGIYFLGLKATGSSAEFRPTLATVLHATFPAAVVSTLVLVVSAFKRASFTGQELGAMVKSNLGAFMPDTASKPLKALASVVDVFNVWQWILLVVGLSIVGKVSRGKAIGIVVVVWGVWALGKMGMAFLQ